MTRQEVYGRSLERLMSEISENCYCAGWNSGLEYDLWGILEGHRRDTYGMDVVGQEIKDELRQLSREAGGWFDGERIVPFDGWGLEYVRWLREDHVPALERYAVWIRERIGTKDFLKRVTTQADADAADAAVADARALVLRLSAEGGVA